MAIPEYIVVKIYSLLFSFLNPHLLILNKLIVALHYNLYSLLFWKHPSFYCRYTSFFLFLSIENILYLFKTSDFVVIFKYVVHCCRPTYCEFDITSYRPTQRYFRPLCKDYLRAPILQHNRLNICD